MAADPWAEFRTAPAASAASSSNPWAEFRPAYNPEPGRAAAARAQAAYDAGVRDPAYDASTGGGTLSVGPFDTGIQTPQWLDRALAGSGKLFTDFATGAQQIGASVADTVAPRAPTMSGLIAGQPQSRTAQLEQQVADQRQLDRQLMDTFAGKAGYFAPALAAAFLPGANTVAGSTIMGGTMGALTPTAEGESRLLNTGFGAGTGYLGAKLSNAVTDKLAAWRQARQARQAAAAQGASASSSAGATATAGGGSSTVTANPQVNGSVTGSGGGYDFGYVGADQAGGLTESQAAALARGQELGFRTTPGQASGSKGLQQLEAKLESQPMTSGRFWAIKDHNQQNLNGIVARSIGERSNVVDDVVMGRARERIGGVFERAATDAPRTLDQDAFLGSLARIEDHYSGMLPGNESIAKNPLVSQLFDLVSRGQASGRQLHALSSRLGRLSRSQMTSKDGNRELAMALGDVKDLADDMLGQGLPPEMQAELRTARQQWRTLLQLESPGVVNTSSGNVSGPSLANFLARSDKNGFIYGGNQSPLYSAARFAQAFRPIVGDSGTATRAPLNGVIDFAGNLAMQVPMRLYTSQGAATATANTMNAARAASRAAGPVASPVLDPLMPILLPGVRAGSNALIPYLRQ